MPGNTNTFGGALRDISKTAARETKEYPLSIANYL